MRLQEEQGWNFWWAAFLTEPVEDLERLEVRSTPVVHFCLSVEKQLNAVGVDFDHSLMVLSSWQLITRKARQWNLFLLGCTRKHIWGNAMRSLWMLMWRQRLTLSAFLYSSPPVPPGFFFFLQSLSVSLKITALSIQADQWAYELRHVCLSSSAPTGADHHVLL